MNAYAQRMDEVLYPFHENMVKEFEKFKKLLVSEYGIQVSNTYLVQYLLDN